MHLMIMGLGCRQVAGGREHRPKSAKSQQNHFDPSTGTGIPVVWHTGGDLEGEFPRPTGQNSKQMLLVVVAQR